MFKLLIPSILNLIGGVLKYILPIFFSFKYGKENNNKRDLNDAKKANRLRNKIKSLSNSDIDDGLS